MVPHRGPCPKTGLSNDETMATRDLDGNLTQSQRIRRESWAIGWVGF